MLRRMFAASLLCLPAAVQAEEATVVITAKDCARLLRHQPAAAVAYQPGTGAKGRKVAPADLPGSGNTIQVLPETFEIPITINPVGWVERNAANKSKGAAETGLATTQADKDSAQAQLAALAAQKTTLDAKTATLAGELAALNAEKATLVAERTAMENEISLGTRSTHDRFYVRKRQEVAAKETQVSAKQGEITANADALAANAAAQVRQQGIIDAAPDKAAGHSAAKAEAEGKLSALSSRGLDESAMTVGIVRYDTVRGAFTYNGQPMGSADEQAMAEACAKRGVK